MSKKEEKIVEINETETIEVPEVPDIPGDGEEEKGMEKENSKKDEKKVFLLFRPFVAVGHGVKKAYSWAKKNPGKAIMITNGLTAIGAWTANSLTQNMRKKYTAPMPIETNFVDNMAPSIDDISIPEIPVIPDIPKISDIPEIPDIPVTD